MSPIMRVEEIPQCSSVETLAQLLAFHGCRLCSLGFQPEINGCCVYRGNPQSKLMLIGEAPGKEEDAKGLPFSGPAGRLLDEIWQSVGRNTNDWYLTNTCLCRPFSPRGSGKENFTPKTEQRKHCRIFLDMQIELLQPTTIVTIGAIATSAILNDDKPIKMGDYRGRLFDDRVVRMRQLDGSILIGRPFIFPMIHPAALLHAKGNQELYDTYRQMTWDDIRILDNFLIEKGF